MAYETMTAELIRGSILEATGANVNTDEGTFTSDMAAAVAYEMFKLYQQLEAVLQAAFINTTDTDYLEARAAEYGLTRKAGTKATGEITVTGTVGATLPAGAIVMTAGGLKYVTDSAVTLTGTTATVDITAESVGVAYNADIGDVNTLGISYAGITSITNAAGITGGVDAETDEALRARLFVRLSAPATSGNANHYKQWALEVDGIGGAKVTPLASGAGTVGVLVVDADKAPPTSEAVAACAAYIETVRPIGATVTVTGASATTINVTASIEMEESATLAGIETALSAALTAYFKEIAFETYTVSVNKIGYYLLGIPGVKDYSGLLLNGGSSSITIPDANVPVLGEVTLSEIV